MASGVKEHDRMTYYYMTNENKNPQNKPKQGEIIRIRTRMVKWNALEFVKTHECRDEMIDKQRREKSTILDINLWMTFHEQYREIHWEQNKFTMEFTSKEK